MICPERHMSRKTRSDPSQFHTSDENALVVTPGETLTSLRYHIAAGGGTILAATVLSHKAAVASHLGSRRRPSRGWTICTEIATFSRENIGHDLVCLCESERQSLVEWAEIQAKSCRSGTERLHLLRARLTASQLKASNEEARAEVQKARGEASSQDCGRSSEDGLSFSSVDYGPHLAPIRRSGIRRDRLRSERRVQQFATYMTIKAWGRD
jgi:hypothetical protein